MKKKSSNVTNIHNFRITITKLLFVYKHIHIDFSYLKI